MFVEQLVNHDKDGSFTFTDGEYPSVEVQTPFTNQQLTDIFSITGEGSAWSQFSEILKLASFKSSGIARSIFFDQSTHLPVGYGLANKEVAIMRMNVVLTITDLFTKLIDLYPKEQYISFTFRNDNPEYVVDVLARLKQDVSTLLLENEWMVDTIEAEPGAVSIIDWLQGGFSQR